LRKENKLVNLRCLGYITAKFHQNIPIVAEIGLSVPTHPRIRYTKSFNHIVHGHLKTKVYEICYTYKALRGIFTLKIWQGLQQKIFGESQKYTNVIASRI